MYIYLYILPIIYCLLVPLMHICSAIMDVGPALRTKSAELRVPQPPAEQILGPRSLVPGPYPSWIANRE